jgi:rSAM/selenodomain-associated transferase 1
MNTARVMASPGGAFVVFAKWPRVGRVKTRLARHLGVERATELATAFLLDTLASLVSCDMRVILAVDYPPDSSEVPPGVELTLQGSGNLGDRLERVLTHLLISLDWAAAIGADSPGLPSGVFAQAAASLSSTNGPDAIVGPARDGGYYLLGLRKVPSGLLRGIRWSTPFTLADTEARLRSAGLFTTRLPMGFDVDEPADLELLRWLLAEGRIHAPRTRAALDRVDPGLLGMTFASRQ